MSGCYLKLYFTRTVRHTSALVLSIVKRSTGAGYSHIIQGSTLQVTLTATKIYVLFVPSLTNQLGSLRSVVWNDKETKVHLLS